jgi:hypothetical protein
MPQRRRVVEALELYVAFVGIPDVTIGSNFSREQQPCMSGVSAR